MSTDAQGRSQPPEWIEPETPPGEVFGPIPSTPPLPHSANPNGDGPSPREPEERPLQSLTQEALMALEATSHTGAPGGEPIITGYGCETQVAGEIAHRKGNGLWDIEE